MGWRTSFSQTHDNHEVRATTAARGLTVRPRPWAPQRPSTSSCQAGSKSVCKAPVCRWWTGRGHWPALCTLFPSSRCLYLFIWQRNLIKDKAVSRTRGKICTQWDKRKVVSVLVDYNLTHLCLLLHKAYWKQFSIGPSPHYIKGKR